MRKNAYTITQLKAKLQLVALLSSAVVEVVVVVVIIEVVV